MGRLEEALNDCNSASTLRGNQDWVVFKLRGQIFMKMKKFKEAAEQFESLILQMDDMGILNVYIVPNVDRALMNLHV